MGLAAYVERRLCPGLPRAHLAHFDTPRTRAALRAWARRHRLLVASGLLDGLALPFHRPCRALGGPPAPSQACYEEWLAAMRTEADRPVPDCRRLTGTLAEGEAFLERLRAFEREDQRLMHARRLRAMAVSSLGAVAAAGGGTALALAQGEGWAVAALGGWFLLAAGCALLRERVVAPLLASRP